MLHIRFFHGETAHTITNTLQGNTVLIVELDLPIIHPGVDSFKLKCFVASCRFSEFGHFWDTLK